MTAPAPPASRSAPPASTPASHSSKRELAAAAVVAKPSPSAQTQQQPATDVPLLTPSIEAIWASFRTSGQDTEMLKLLLLAKAKEDERLAALDHLRTEQLRAANTIALHQYWYQYQAFMAQAQAQAHGQLPPYSPTSPPPSSKRPRAPSDASNSSTGDEQTSKKPRTFVAAQGAGRKPSHEAVMEALRRKCQANQSQSSVSAPPASSSSSSSASSHSSPPAPLVTSHRPLAPAPAPHPHRSSPSLSPPLPPPHCAALPIPRRLSPPSLPSRHTSFLRPANAPSALAPSSSSSSSSSSSAHPPPPPSSSHVAPPPLSLSLSPVQEEASSSSSSHRPHHHQQQPPSTRDKLAMLLHATDAAAAASLRNEAARTSDVRGEQAPAAAVAAAT